MRPVFANPTLSCRSRRGGAGVGVWRVARSTPVPTATTARRPTVLICRTTGTMSRGCLVRTPEEIAYLVNGELELLQQGGVRVARGDARCIAFGHVIRRKQWELGGEAGESRTRDHRARRLRGCTLLRQPPTSWKQISTKSYLTAV